jgi:hypothetical protein
MSLITKFYYGDIPDEKSGGNETNDFSKLPLQGLGSLGPPIGPFGKFLSAASRD